MFELIKDLGVPMVYGPFPKESVQKVDYYLTRPSNGLVRLAAKCTLKSGEQYGNVISIPFDTLCNLIDNVRIENAPSL